FWRPNSRSRCSRTESPKPLTDSESPIISTFGGGGGGDGLFGFWNLLARTREPMTTSKPTETETVRIIADHCFLSRGLWVSRFILDANVRFQLDPAGIVLRFYRIPKGAVQRTQLKLVGPADSKFFE